MTDSPNSAPQNSAVPLLYAVGAMMVGAVICALTTAPTDLSAQLPPEVEVDPLTGDWPQWGGNGVRNNIPDGRGIPTDWDVGDFDSKTNEWVAGSSDQVKWVSRLGSQTYGNPVVADRRVFVGTNNGAGYLPRYPADVDLGCLLAFSSEDGSFLWQHSSEKLASGRAHDWPLQGICCAPLVEGDRLWFVTSRGTVVCADTQGYYDKEDDGPIKAGMVKLFTENPDITSGLDDGLTAGVRALLEQQKVSTDGRIRMNGSAEEGWQMRITTRKGKSYFRLQKEGSNLGVFQLADKDDTQGELLCTAPVMLTAGLDAGQPGLALVGLLASRGSALEEATVAQNDNGWTVQGTIDGVPREVQIRREGSLLEADLRSTVADVHEADEVWVFDMMGTLNISQHNMCSCSVTSFGDILFVNTSNGVDEETHVNIPSVDAPSFIALDKKTGKLLWADGSPGANILHGQWSSPAVGVLAGVPQAIFAGGDGWVYSFKADGGQNGAPELLWKFDANPKTSEWVIGGRGTRNNIISTPVLVEDRVYVAVGQDPEHGEGIGNVFCLDASKRGDISAELAVRSDDPSTPIPHRRLQAVNEEDGEQAIANPNSGVVWSYSTFDQNGDGEIDFEETMHRTLGTPAIKNGLLFIADLSGLFHCLDANTGKVHWTYDMLASAWGSPLIVDNHVYIGDEDGELAVFDLTSEPHEPLAEIDMRNSVYGAAVVSNNVLYIANKTHLFAIPAGE